jgi:hypothetical protein
MKSKVRRAVKATLVITLHETIAGSARKSLEILVGHPAVAIL